MKLIKKITAAVTAMAMAAGMMSVGASAENYSLHQAYMAPSSENVIKETLYISALYNGRAHGVSTSFSLTSGDVEVDVLKYHPIYGYGIPIGTTIINGTGLFHIYSSLIFEDDDLIVTVKFSYPYAYGYAYGSYT